MATKRQILDTLAKTITLLKDAGAEYAEATYNESSSIEIGLRDGRVQSLVRTPNASDITMSVRIGHKGAGTNPNTKRADLLKDSARAIVAAARLKTDNPDQDLPDRALLSKIHNNRSLDLLDRTKPSVDEMIESLRIAESAARSVPHVTSTDSASADWSRSKHISLTSTGDVFEIESSSSSFGVSVLAENNGPIASNGDYTIARHRADLRDPAAVGRIAGEKASAALNPRKPPEGKFPVVFDPDIASTLLSHFAQAASGGNIFMDQSFMNRDTLGQNVLASGITIINDPHKLRGLRSSIFTDSGLPTKTTPMVENGVLKALFLGLESSRRLGFPLTASTGGPHNLTIQPGTVTRQALLESVKEGFYVTSVMGQGVNIANGNYSRGASGFWIENGIITHAIAEATIAGNLKDMFMNMVAADDLDARESATASPTLRVDGMTIA